jgi:hypothetical protein
LLIAMKTCVALVLLAAATLAAAVLPASAGDYSLAHRPPLVFPGGRVHTSPFPMSKRTADIWLSDACWHDCTSHGAWKLESCLGGRGPSHPGQDACRAQLDARDRACLRQCRLSGGPLLNITDY